MAGSGKRLILLGLRTFTAGLVVDHTLRIGEILLALYLQSEDVRIEREKREEAQRKAEEEKRQKELRRQKYNEEVDRLQALINEARDYETACQIRAYVAAVEARHDLDDDTIEWVTWAKTKADWYDPTVAMVDPIFGKREHSADKKEKTPEKDCHISLENMQPVNAPDNAEAKRTRVQEGDLLISITADLGRTGVVTQEIADHGAYINQHLTCIRLNREILEPLYVAYFMESEAGKEQFVSKNQSAVKAGLNFNSINTLRLMVPPKAVQMEFLDFVAQIDKSKFAVQKALDEAQLLFDSLMQKYFG